MSLRPLSCLSQAELEVAQRLLDARPLHVFYLAQMTENAASVTSYAKLGFVPIQQRVQIDLMR